MFSNNIWDLPGADAFILISCDTLIAYRYMAAGCPTTNLGVSQIWGAHIYSVTIFSPVFFCCCCSLFLPHAILQLLYIDITILSWVDSSHIIPIKRHIVQRLVYESSKSLFTLKTSSRAGLSCRTSRFNNCKERGKKTVSCQIVNSPLQMIHVRRIGLRSLRYVFYFLHLLIWFLDCPGGPISVVYTVSSRIRSEFMKSIIINLFGSRTSSERSPDRLKITRLIHDYTTAICGKPPCFLVALRLPLITGDC